MTPVFNMSSRISSSAFPAERGGRRGDCLIGVNPRYQHRAEVRGRTPNPLNLSQKWLRVGAEHPETVCLRRQSVASGR